MRIKNKEKVLPYLTPKGLAVIAIIKSGLLPKVEGGWDDSKFNIFWNEFENSLIKKGYLIIKVSKN